MNAQGQSTSDSDAVDASIDFSPPTPVIAATQDNRQTGMLTIELLTAVVLALTTVLSAWCAYQAARWNGVQAVLFAEAGAARMDAVQQSDLADIEKAIDIELFAHYVVAMSDQDEDLADFLYRRFRPEMLIAMDAWLAMQPFENRDAPLSPFVMPEYALAASKEAGVLHDMAEQKATEARRVNQISDNYVLLTVLLASVLFFSGLANKLDSRNIRLAFLILGASALVVAVGVMLTFPVQ